ncbi:MULTISPECIES: STAS domain-containing protein [unclassified Rhizobium]|uniref:STAS domain-containing protein n=1 Tax=unclassified Rhizobium TaxID=2613769 RepID=UPI001602211E|nr:MULTISPECIES: STAS domain-containing protein [unclassified Rhizobium]MBB1250592.1 STAS domain-containing protein [Rhizobium sp. G21]MCV3764678.1 STAS domain-containing protein [Rhizobium sp. TRM95796]
MTYSMPAKANIRNIRDIHAELLDYSSSSTQIEIDLGNCEDIDLSFLQLIESVRKSAAAGGKPVTLSRPANAAVKTALKRAGFLDVLSTEDAKFWLHEGMQ